MTAHSCLEKGAAERFGELGGQRRRRRRRRRKRRKRRKRRRLIHAPSFAASARSP